MQAMALIEVLEDLRGAVRRATGSRPSTTRCTASGLDVGRQILAGTTKPDDMSEAEFFSFYATVINRIAYASLEAPKIDGAGPGELRHPVVPAPGPLPGVRLPRAALLRARA